jgi:hypothetical protein
MLAGTTCEYTDIALEVAKSPISCPARSPLVTMSSMRKSSATSREFWDGKHRYEHWYRDNTVYFITSKVRDGYPAFASEAAKNIFWDRFDHYAKLHGFVPWIAPVMNNHYHFVGYLRDGEQLGEMMRKLHGSVAWLVMKEIDVRHVPFWRSSKGKDYFDGCLRDVLQAFRAFNYTRDQAVKARIVRDYRDYPHTRIYLDRDRAIKRAVELKAFLEEVPYARYERKKKHGHQR